LLLIWSSIQTGAFYGLLGLAYLLIARSTGILNFAVGGYAMLGGITYGGLASRGMPLAPAIVLGLCIAMLASLVTEQFVVRPISNRGRDEFAAVMAIVALLFVLEQLAGVVFGHRAVVSPRLTDGYRRLGDFIVDDQQILGVVFSLVIFVLVASWIQRGTYGRMLRAVGDHSEAAVALGLPVRRIRLAAMAIAGLVAGSAGIIVAPLAGLTNESATSFTIVGFIAMVMGGLGTAWAPLAGGLLLGALQTLGSRYIGGASADYILFVVVLVLFTFRPQGLFAVHLRT
jgi:branched-chain amino acid transport system permease protein